MKKRTVITTKKHEVWVIRQGDEEAELQDQTNEDSGGDSKGLSVTTNDDENVRSVRKDKNDEQS